MTSSRPVAVSMAIVASLTAGLLAVVQLKASRPMLIAERFVAGGGWVEIAVLAAYAAWVFRAMADPSKQPKWRLRVWLLFSIVFFLQLLVGLAGAERFLMSGELHLPIPAMVLAGPLYRGELTFMLIVLGASLVLVGPAWCSHLCYFGAWDGLAASRVNKPAPSVRSARGMQIAILILLPGVAVALNRAGIPGTTATLLGGAFGIGGVFVMTLLSRRTGAMIHCIAYCPLGALATLAGKVSPFRMRIDSTCDRCGACTPACRYGALSEPQVARGRPGPSCTLCGDCVRRCKHGSVQYRLPGLRPETARTVFLVIVVSLHAVFLGVAMA